MGPYTIPKYIPGVTRKNTFLAHGWTDRGRGQERVPALVDFKRAAATMARTAIGRQIMSDAILREANRQAE